jgi:glutamyl-tRNA reductase
MPAHLAEADIIVTSTGSPLPILGKGSMERALKQRRHRPVFIVDIAVPRDVEPEVGQLADVYLYTVDDLEEIIDENLQSRREAAAQAEEIIETQVHRFMDWVRGLDATGTICRYREDAQALRDHTLRQALRLLETGRSPQETARYLAYTLTNRLTHNPSVAMKRAGQEGHTALLDAARELLNLKDH